MTKFIELVGKDETKSLSININFIQRFVMSEESFVYSHGVSKLDYLHHLERSHKYIMEKYSKEVKIHYADGTKVETRITLPKLTIYVFDISGETATKIPEHFLIEPTLWNRTVPGSISSTKTFKVYGVLAERFYKQLSQHTIRGALE